MALRVNFKIQTLLIFLTKVLNTIRFKSNVGKEISKPNIKNKGKDSKTPDAFLRELPISSISTTPIGPIRTVNNHCLIGYGTLIKMPI
jgi:hypothetical protein